MFTLFFRGALLYIIMIVVMRGLGKRQLGEFQPFELAIDPGGAGHSSSPCRTF